MIQRRQQNNLMGIDMRALFNSSLIASKCTVSLAKKPGSNKDNKKEARDDLYPSELAQLGEEEEKAIAQPLDGDHQWNIDDTVDPHVSNETRNDDDKISKSL